MSASAQRQRRQHFGVGLLVMLLLSTLASLASAQPALKSVEGTLSGVEQKGRVTFATVQPEQGEPLTLALTPRLNVEVTAPGDEGFLRPGQFITTLATMSNQRLFTTEINVHLLGERRPPAGKIMKAPPMQGASQNTYQVSGPIVSRQTDADYPDYQTLTLKVAGPSAPLMLEQGFQVQVKSSDLTQVPVGTSVTLVGNELRGGRFNATGIKVKLTEPWNSADVLKEADSGAEVALRLLR